MLSLATRNFLRRTFAVIWGLVSLFLVFFANFQASFVGFPDGSITAYERETEFLWGILILISGLQGLYFLIAGALGRLPPYMLTLIALIIPLAVAPMLLVPACPALQPCIAAYETISGKMMDHGIGG